MPPLSDARRQQPPLSLNRCRAREAPRAHMMQRMFCFLPAAAASPRVLPSR